MNSIIVLIAAVLFIAAIIVGSITDSTWKNVSITWTLLSTGVALFGIALTL